MKTTLIIALAAVTTAAYAQLQQREKSIEIIVGGVLYQGDRDDADTGILAGFEYYTSPGYYHQSRPFFGARFHKSEDAGFDLLTYGAHYGVRYRLSGYQMGGSAFYAKIAAGYYNSDVDVDDKWGFGGFAAIGMEMQQNFGIEVGYQLAPSVSGYDNKSFYGAIAFRL